MKISLHTMPFLLMVMLLTTSCQNKNSDKDFFFDGEYPPIEAITITENGNSYEIPAVSGQCIAFFKDETTNDKSKLIIERNGGKIIEQMPEFNYYLASVKNGKENDFIERMRNEPQVEYVFLNTISTELSEVFILDNFMDVEPEILTTHGNAVQMTFSKYSGANSHVTGKNRKIMNKVQAETKAGLYWKAIKVLITANSLCTEMFNAVKEVSTNSMILFNFSFGPGLEETHKKLFDEVSEQTRLNYIEDYYRGLENLTECITKMRSKGYLNFLVSKSSGNEGMHEMEMILAKLDANTLQSLEENLVLVNAYDTKTQKPYSNNVKSKHPLVTTIDVSQEPWCGTSFAAPKLLGFVDRISATYTMLNAQDILTAIRNATPKDTNQPMTYEMLEWEAAKLAENRKQCKKFTFTLNMTSDYCGEWDLSDGKKQDIVKYHVNDTYGYEYLSGEKMAIEIDNQTNYDLGILLSASDSDDMIRPLEYVLEKGKKESFYAEKSQFAGNSEHISVREIKITITTR